jgi:predicted HicB family RNase H-like nuclease
MKAKEKKIIMLRVTPELHRRLKQFALDRSISMQVIIVDVLQTWFPSKDDAVEERVKLTNK